MDLYGKISKSIPQKTAIFILQLLILFFAYSVLSLNIYSIWIPILLFIFFAFYNIPKLDAYLAEKYKDEFKDYSKRTKKFIPFIY